MIEFSEMLGKYEQLTPENKRLAREKLAELLEQQERNQDNERD